MISEHFFLLKGRTFLSEGPVNIGLIDAEDGVYLIDSGNDKDAGRRLMKKIREAGRELRVVINTHSNADHIGGNAWLQNNTDCRIWAPALESAFIEDPLLEPSFLWGGYPFKQLRTKFFQAKPSKPDRIISESSEAAGLRFVSLPGHFFNHYGVLTEDGVFFLGDSLFGGDVIDKYGLPFIYDVKAYRRSIEKIKNTGADWYVVSHGEPVRDISETAELNLKTVNDAEYDLLRLLQSELTFEEVLKKFCDSRGINLNAGQYLLVGSTVKSFLAQLCDDARAEFLFKDNRFFWKAC